MREIRFRAWDKDDEEMHKDVTPMYRDGGLENIIFDYENAGYDFVDIEIKYCDTVFLYEDNPYIIMQYTGLKDKNGMEIYEYNELDGAYEVIFQDSKYILRHISNNVIIDLYDYWRGKNGEIEVTREYTKV